VRLLGDAGEVGMVAEIFGKSAAKEAHAGAVDDGNAE
jgi:hypothetical protein